MNPETFIPIFSVILTVIGAGLGYFLKHIIEKRKEAFSQITNERRELYQNFINLIIDLFSTSKTGKSLPDKQVLIKIFDFYKKYILYGSPEVINSFSDYFQYIYSTNSDSTKMNFKIHFQKLTKIMIEMRKDLGLSNKKLGKNGEKIFRALITDFDQIMK